MGNAKANKEKHILANSSHPSFACLEEIFESPLHGHHNEAQLSRCYSRGCWLCAAIGKAWHSGNTDKRSVRLLDQDCTINDYSQPIQIQLRLRHSFTCDTGFTSSEEICAMILEAFGCSSQDSTLRDEQVFTIIWWIIVENAAFSHSNDIVETKILLPISVQTLRMPLKKNTYCVYVGLPSLPPSHYGLPPLYRLHHYHQHYYSRRPETHLYDYHHL